MQDFLISSAVSLGLILVSTAIFYEIVAHCWVLLPKLKGPRSRIIFTIACCFLAHTLSVWLFGATEYVLAHDFQQGALSGSQEATFMDYIYFSGVSYSSLGFGHVDAMGTLRMLTVVESILGLIFIGWTVGFTYAVTEKYLYHRRNPKA